MKKADVTSVLDIINQYMQNITLTEKNLDDNLVELGLESISFIRIVVSLEETFECEIPDSKLLITELNTVTKIIDTLTAIEKYDSLFKS